MTDKKWGHDELAHDLAKKFRVNDAMMVWENMQMGSSGSIRPDVYVLKKSYSSFQPVTYEVKISRSDFLSDVTSGKWQGYLQFSSAVVFAVPKGLVTKDEIPAGCGLIVRSEKGWRTTKRPTLNVVDTLPHKVWMKMLIDGVDRAGREAIKKRPQASEYLLEQRLRDKLGKDAAVLIRNVIAEQSAVERQHEALKATREKLRNKQKSLEDQERQQWSTIHDNFVRLARSLGLQPDCKINDLRIALYRASERLKRDDEINRLTRQLESIKRALEIGLEPLPGEKEEDQGELFK